MANGAVKRPSLAGSGGGDDKKQGYCTAKTPDDTEGQQNHHINRNQISEWQAGWNVTNAIQVAYVA